MCGDLNISYQSSAPDPADAEGTEPLVPSVEYLELLSTLSARDLFLSPHPTDSLPRRQRVLSYDPATNPYVAERYRLSQEQARMDYILGIDRLLPEVEDPLSPTELEGAEKLAGALEFMPLDGRIEILGNERGEVCSDHWALVGAIWPLEKGMDQGSVEEVVARIP